jgi:hypothetical protein
LHGKYQALFVHMYKICTVIFWGNIDEKQANYGRFGRTRRSSAGARVLVFG